MNNVGNNTLLDLKTPLHFFLILIFLSPVSVSIASDKTLRYWTTAGHYNWVHKISAAQTPLTAYLNDNILPKQNKIISNYKGFFHARIALKQLESNKIVIKQGEKILFSADIFQAKYYESEMVPDNYTHLIFHIQEKENVCKECHRLEIKEIDREPIPPEDSLCYSCHSHSFTDYKYQHSAAGIEWLCLRCHQQEYIESETIPDTLIRFTIEQGDSVAPLCYQCHPVTEKETTAHEFIHGPIGMEGCNMCHNPHGSQVIKLLEKDATSLCIECHELQDMFELPNVHPVLKKEGCPACHDSHSSDFQYQLRAEVKDICYTCHPSIKKTSNNHPVSGHPVSGAINPTNPDTPFSCVSCHNPHSSEHDNLLSEEDPMMVCITCHPMGN